MYDHRKNYLWKLIKSTILRGWLNPRIVSQQTREPHNPLTIYRTEAGLTPEASGLNIHLVWCNNICTRAYAKKDLCRNRPLSLI